MNRIVELLVRKNLDSWLRAIATAAGGWLATNSIPTGNILEAFTGGLLLAIGFLTMWIDAADGPGDKAITLWRALVGPRERDVAGALARKLILLLFAGLHGLGLRFDDHAVLNGDIVSFLALLLGFAAERALKFLPLAKLG